MRATSNPRFANPSSTIPDPTPARPDPQALLQNVASRLRQLAAMELLTVHITLCDSKSGAALVRALDPAPEKIAAEPVTSMDVSPAGVVWREQQPLVISASNDCERFPRYVVWMKELGIRTEWVLPITVVDRRLGAIGFGSMHGRSYDRSEISALQSMLTEHALVFDGILNLREARAELARERDRARLLLEINNALVSHLDLDDLWARIADCLLRIVPHEFSGLALYDPKNSTLRTVGSRGRNGGLFGEELVPLTGSAAGVAFLSGQPLVLSPANLDHNSGARLRLQQEKSFGSGCMLPLTFDGKKLGVLGLVSRRERVFEDDRLQTLLGVAAQISIAVENALTHRELESLKNSLRSDKQYLDEEIQTSCDFDLVGNSDTFLQILKQIEVVAPTDSTVLIQGETGTGKELLAIAIHQLSSRRERALVKVNCSAIPTGLLESELFGHEKGAFTGAIARRVGRFELAHQGTLFLDEIGDIPRELQPKLLRVLQEQEFERVGGASTIRVNVRLVAATNANLAQMVADKQFRSDLYYRLNVFPINVPPLRERPGDIVPLALRFAQKFARRMKKPVEVIPPEVQHALLQYHWPGNIRELQNVIERAVILSHGPVLEIPMAEFTPVARESTLAGIEREHIVRTLRESNWVLSGKNGAANRLGLNRSTLQSRMRKLGIRRPQGNLAANASR